MCLRTVSQDNKPTHHMSETLAKGKACLACRARKSVRVLLSYLAVLILPVFA